MTRPIVIVESPYAGDIERNTRYARAALADCIKRGESPFASHLLYTQPGVLNEAIPGERELGIIVGLAFHRVANICAVYTDLGQTQGMWKGITMAKMVGIPVEYRTLPGEW